MLSKCLGRPVISAVTYRLKLLPEGKSKRLRRKWSYHQQQNGLDAYGRGLDKVGAGHAHV